MPVLAMCCTAECPYCDVVVRYALPLLAKDLGVIKLYLSPQVDAVCASIYAGTPVRAPAFAVLHAGPKGFVRNGKPWNRTALVDALTAAVSHKDTPANIAALARKVADEIATLTRSRM